MTLEFLQIVWFALVGILLVAFLTTGGFDFGAGIVIGFGGGKRSRDLAIKKILPFWDANQVWLITAGGALFAAFPLVYAQILSTMYTPVMLLLMLLVVRVIGIEFYFLEDGDKWRNFWANVIFVSSSLSVILIGVALGAIFSGAVLQESKGFWDNFCGLFNLLSIASGMLVFAFFAAYGARFLAAKSQTANANANPFAKRAKLFQMLLMIVFIFYAISLMLHFRGRADMFICVVGLAISYVCLSASSRLGRRNKLYLAFFADSAFVLAIVATHCIVAFPYIIPSSDLAGGIAISEASSSLYTLKTMLIVALVGVPLAIGYNVYAHNVFRK